MFSPVSHYAVSIHKPVDGPVFILAAEGEAPKADKPAADKGKPKGKGLNFAEDFLLGGTAAAVAKTIAAPIERIKLLLQNQGESKAITEGKGEYKGIIDCLVRVPKEQGFGSFWRGNLANVMRYFPTQALNFMFKEQYKRLFDVPKTAPFYHRLYSNVASGGAAGATSLLVVYPLDFARTRLAVDVGTGKDREFKGVVDCIMKTAQKSGWFKGGVYNGFVVSCVGIVVYRGAYFGLYDTISAQPEMRKLGFFGKFMLGYAVTTVAGLAAYPLDTIRRRMMMTSGKAGKGEVAKYKNSIHATQIILKEKGVGAFFKGAGSNVLRGLAGALVLVGFDYMQDFYLQFKYGADAAVTEKGFKG
jgi:solute carrier family 25 (adenine nucleotide translocator) protein 4/5/6/31